MPKKYLKISNSGEIPLHGIRLLGQSNKKTTQIGQFGTGLKEAIALCLRKNLDFIIWSGLNRIDFFVDTIDGQQEVCFKITPLSNDSKLSERFVASATNPMGFSPRLGQKDWNSEWQILREVICNAIDEGEYTCTYTDDCIGVSGKTTVYISASEKISEEMSLICGDVGLRPKILDESDRQLVFLEKEKESLCKVYCKGVFINEFNFNSLYDYNFDNLKITESRSSDLHEVLTQLGHHLYHTADTGVIEKFIRNIQKLPSLEGMMNRWHMNSTPRDICDSWRDAWIRVWGPNAYPCNAVEVVAMLQRRGFIGLHLTNSLYEMMKMLTGKDWEQVLTDLDKLGIEIVPTTKENRKDFDKVWNILEKNSLTFNKYCPDLKIFRSVGQNVGLKGRYEKNVVYINERVLGSHEGLVTALEELGHHISGATDCSEDFQNWLLDALALALRL